MSNENLSCGPRWHMDGDNGAESFTTTPDPDIDYRMLLAKYMARVIASEGVSYINECPCGMGKLELTEMGEGRPRSFGNSTTRTGEEGWVTKYT